MRTSFVLALALAGCADVGIVADPYTCVAAGGAGCFVLPTRAVAAVDADGRPTAAVLDCAAYQTVRSTAPVTLAGKTVNAIDRAAIALVDIDVFADGSMTEQIGEVISDDVGAYTLTIDGMPGELFARTHATGALPVHLLHQRLDVTATRLDMLDLVTATRANLDGVLASVGDARMPGTSQLTGHAHDCAGNRLVNVVANIAPAPAEDGEPAFEPGVHVYYEADGPMPALGRRRELQQTTPAGGFVATSLVPGHHVVQLWGFTDDAALARGRDGLALLGETAIVVPADDAWLFAAIHATR
jgi:hypothetical protein